MSNRIYPGTIITCAWCEKDLYRITEELEKGDYVDCNNVVPLGKVPEPGFYFPKTCFYCHETFYLDRCIHTESGWFPHKPTFIGNELRLPE